MLISKEALPDVEVGFMNDTHDEDRIIINGIYELILKYEKKPSDNNKENINVLYQKWFNHTVDHFNNEEIRMRETNFPAYELHKVEHDKVLAIMHEVFSAWQHGSDISVLKNYFVEILPLWIIQHIETMDIVTAHFFNTGEISCAI